MKLGEAGDGEVVIGGSGPNPNAKPRVSMAAARVAAFVDSPPVASGVQPLNPGFFKLERMRSESVAKKRASVKVEVRG